MKKTDKLFNGPIDFVNEWKMPYKDVPAEEKQAMAKSLLEIARNNQKIYDANNAYEYLCEARPIDITNDMFDMMKKIALSQNNLTLYHNAMVTFSLLYYGEEDPIPVSIFRAFTKCLYADAVKNCGEDNFDKIKEYYREWLDFSHEKGGLDRKIVEKYGLATDGYLNTLKIHYTSDSKNNPNVHEIECE